ncbi:MAG: peptidase, partial [Solirubrobacteraceae bacterium]|nr:peptidase [Solirubrobacteraceae bacterium]
MPRFTSPLAEELAEDVLERFLRYARIDTRSQLDREQSPSTPGQLDLARLLVSELTAMGIEDAELDDNGYVMATLPGDGPVIGLLAHVDTSPEVSGTGVEPIVHRDYDGRPIALPRNGVVVDTPTLRAKTGEDIVTASGDTLLGADDKAGVAEIMGAVAHLVAHPELPRPTLRIGFTPDEEIGEGATLFDIERFGARFAYTLDGSTLGELTDETFTGWEAMVTFKGVDVHPGFATGKLVSALRLAGRFLAALPADRAPETTSGREGFIHPFEASGGTAEAAVRLILRDFEDDRLQEMAGLVRRLADEVVAQAPGAAVTVDVREQYPNMRTHIEPFPEIVETAVRAYAAEGIEPIREPIRGGTDGSVLSARGLPTPNIFAGGHEFHSPREW